MTSIDTNSALVIIDVQQGFDESEWGATNNLGCEDNVDALAAAWVATGRPIVVVRHNSTKAGSSLHPEQPGNALKPSVAALPASLLVTKNVNSAFIGDPDLHLWLGGEGIRQIVICGIQTNMCVETTARMGGNLGYDVIVPLDATRTFGLASGNGDGRSAGADEVMRMTALNLAGGGFATVTSTAELLRLV
jgi:nicotinamidase-related amidase